MGLLCLSITDVGAKTSHGFSSNLAARNVPYCPYIGLKTVPFPPTGGSSRLTPKERAKRKSGSRKARKADHRAPTGLPACSNWLSPAVVPGSDIVLAIGASPQGHAARLQSHHFHAFVRRFSYSLRRDSSAGLCNRDGGCKRSMGAAPALCQKRRQTPNPKSPMNITASVGACSFRRGKITLLPSLPAVRIGPAGQDLSRTA